MAEEVSAYATYNANKKKNTKKINTIKSGIGKTKLNGKAKATLKATNAGNNSEPNRHQVKQNGETIKKVVGNSLNSLEHVVDELYGSVKLTKAQQEKKKELEKYMAEKMDESEYETSGSSIYNGEYTMNSYSECESDESANAPKSSPPILPTTDEENEGPNETFHLNLLPNKNKRKSITKETNNNRKSLIQSTGNSSPNGNKNKQNKTNILLQTKNVSQQPQASKKTAPVTPTHINNGEITIKQERSFIDVNKLNSIEEGLKSFQWLISPMNHQTFFNNYWEQKACLIQREDRNYYAHLISFSAIDRMLVDNRVEFTKNMDITSYKNGK